MDSIKRFAFGKNWNDYINLVNQERIDEAIKSLTSMLDVGDMRGMRFLDIGSGSGLFSLAAHKLGAEVTSFDYDELSVSCTEKLRSLYANDGSKWIIESGSVLDTAFMEQLGQFDIVYSWGVLHHTGNMWAAFSNVVDRVKVDGKLYISIYNDQGRASRYWAIIKRTYNRLPAPAAFCLLMLCLIRLWGPTTIRDVLTGKPFSTWRNYNSLRGMSAWHDVVDWVGGYPFEVARPEQVFEYFRERGLILDKLVTCAGGIGCNEFVFHKPETGLYAR